MQANDLTFITDNLKKMLEENNISANQLAERSNISHQHIRNILNGKRILNLQLLHTIKVVLGLELDQICRMIVNTNLLHDESGEYFEAVRIPKTNLMRNNKYAISKEKYYTNDLMRIYGHLSQEELRDKVAYEVREYYEKEFERIEKANQKISEVNKKMSINNDFSEIVNALLFADDEKLAYINEAIRLYLQKH